MNTVRDDAGLCPRERDGFAPQPVDSHGGQSNGRLFPRRQQHIHFPLGGRGGDFTSQLDQRIGDAAHGGDDNDDLVAIDAVSGHALCDVFDAVGVAHRSTAVFLDDQ